MQNIYNKKDEKRGFCGGIIGRKHGSDPKKQKNDIPLETKNKSEMTEKESETQRFLDFIRETKSKGTLKEYKSGINRFSEWFGKDPDTILKLRREDIASGDFERNRRFAREIEKFHASLIREGYAINSARTLTIGIKQLFNFFGMPCKTKSFETVITTKDFVPRIEQYRAMYNVGDLSTRLVISMGLDLGWRVGDLLNLRKDQIPDLDQEGPIPFDLVTEKEKVISKTFLSAETVELLKAYLPTIEDSPNPYLFPSNGKGHLRGEAISEKLRTASKKAKINIPKGKRLRFHAFRKRFLSTCANLRVDVNIAKILVGKSVDPSMLTYLSEIEHLEAWKEVREEHLSLTNGRIKSTMQAKDEEIKSFIKVIHLYSKIKIRKRTLKKGIFKKEHFYFIYLPKDYMLDLPELEFLVAKVS